MMEYTAQVIGLLPPVPAAPHRFRDKRITIGTVHGVRSLGYEVRAPAAVKTL